MSELSIILHPYYIFVKPMPQLRLDYFLPREVVGDDAFTDEIEEPIPYTLGLRAGNFGSGTAHQVAISSAQPEILENDQGLKIEFAIDNSEVNGEPATPNLLAELGDIPPQAAGVARWNMRCSLSGYFDEFSAELSHADDLGGELTALIKQENVFTHTLIHDVLVELPGRDSIRDFLVTDDPTATAPDYTVFESEYQDHEVPELSDTAELTPLPDEPNRFILSFSTPPSSTCLCVTLPDPGNGAQPLKEVSRTDAAGQSYSYDYNEDGQLVRQTDPSGTSQRYEYDEQGRLWKSIDGSGHEIVREYSAVPSSGSSSSCSSCSGGLFSSSEGDSMERLTKISYPTFTKEFRYDSDGRVSDEVYSFTGGQTITTSYNYDAFGQVQSITGPGGSVSYAYDAMGQKIAVSDPSGTTQFGYDSWGNLHSLTDAAGQMTRFEHDTIGKLLHEIRPLNQQTSFGYDTQGRLDTITDAMQQTTGYGYDDQSRLETIAYADGRSVTLSYDADGNLTGYDDGVTSATYEYDALGRKTKETVDYGSFSKSFSYSYAANGLKSSFTAPDGTVYEYTYGDNNELREISIPNLGAISFADYQWTRPARIVYPGGSTREMDYDGLMRLTQLTSTTAGGNVLLDYSYEYDNSGNIMSKNTEHGEYSYGYDGASRLTSADNPLGEDESYSYDEVGNRTSASNAEGEISHNANNELERYGELEYEYDDNGNLTEVRHGGIALNTYAYNAENRLVQATAGACAVQAEYYYDPFGRRLWKTVNGVTTYFFYSDEGLIEEYGPGGTELRTYGYKPDSTWTTDPLWLKSGGQYSFYQNDHLGTPQQLVSQHGAVMWSARYTAFGQATVDIDTVTNNLRFPGQYYDVETGLHYNFQRYYDPGIGRYMRVDPIGFLSSEVNWYGYVGNNPVERIDVMGLLEADCGPGCCKGQSDYKDGVNSIINDVVNNANIVSDIWRGLAIDQTAFDTIIENKLYQLIERATSPILKTAPCMKLCGFCVGTDKIGHMFQQGRLLYAIKRQMKDEWYAHAFSRWTEGLPLEHFDQKYKDWLKEETFNFYFDGWSPTRLFGDVERETRYGYVVKLSLLREKWGKRWYLEASRADHQANLAGMRLWEVLNELEKAGGLEEANINICDYVDEIFVPVQTNLYRNNWTTSWSIVV